MAMSSNTVTIRGNVGNDPVKSMTASGDPVVNFRVGSSMGHWDRSTGSWVETGTNWYAVSAFRNLAEHAKASLRCGDPVIITGTLKLREWESNGRKGFSADLVADVIGHDLNRGTSAFARRPRTNAPTEQSAEASAPHEEPTEFEKEQWGVAGLHQVASEPQGASMEGASVDDLDGDEVDIDEPDFARA